MALKQKRQHEAPADDDSVSSGLVSSSALPGSDEPPSFDEMLYDPNIFNLFSKYMEEKQATENIFFLREVFHFRMHKAPKKVLVQEARRIIWMYIMEGASSAVNVSAEERDSLLNLCIDPESESRITNTVFRDAYQAIHALTLPLYRAWISTGEWHEFERFHRIPPPDFSVVLDNPELANLYTQYLKKQHGTCEDSEKLWKFALIAKDFREGKMNHEEFATSEGGAAVSKEEYAKKVYRTFKKVIPVPHDSASTYAVFLVTALNSTVERCRKDEAFRKWIALKQYNGVDYLWNSVHQTMSTDGYAVPPTMACILSSGSMRSVLSMLVSGTSAAKSLLFLGDLLEFEYLVRGVAPGKGLSTKSSIDSVEVSTKAEVIEEGKRIFKSYLEDTSKSGMYCDPSLIEEVKNAMKTATKSKKIRSDIFHRVGAFVFHRLERMVGREMRAGLAWTTKSYDNNCKRAREIDAMFDAKQLPDGVDFRLVPSVDDMLVNENLKKDFEAFIPKEMCRVYEEYYAAYIKFIKLPLKQRDSKEVDNMLMQMAAGATQFDDLSESYKTLSKVLSGKSSVCDSPFNMWLFAITDRLISKFYQDWVNKRFSFWSKERWSLAKEANYNRLSVTYSAGDASTKGSTESKRGLGLFSRKKKLTSTPSTKNLHSGSSKDSLMSSPPMTNLNSARSSVEPGSSARSDTSGSEEVLPVTITFVIPTVLEALSSTYFRKMLQTYYLESHLMEDDMALWKKFSSFVDKYQPMTDADIESCQDEMRAAALEILDKHESFMKKGYFLRAHIQKKGLITPAFFRDEEVNLIGRYYTGFEMLLRQRGWVSPA